MPTLSYQTTIRFAYESESRGPVRVQATVLCTRQVVINSVRRRGTYHGQPTYWYVELPEDERRDIMNLAQWYAEDRGFQFFFPEVCA